MNRLFVTLFFSLAVITASSQRIYFIYLQTDPQQPFFVKMDEKLYSSSASGYLVLPRLKDSTYIFSIGFNSGGEHKFACTINKKDHGYLVKNFGEKGWGLYDLQTSAVQMAIVDGKKDAAAVNVPVNAFTELLSKAADDSTLRQKVVLPVEEQKQAAIVKTTNTTDTGASSAIPEKTVAKEPQTEILLPANSVAVGAAREEPKKEATTIRDTAANKPQQVKSVKEETRIVAAPVVNAVTVPVAKEEPKSLPGDKANHTAGKEIAAAQTTDAYTKTKVVRKSESSTTEGFGVTYIDAYPDGKQDTIVLMIPNDNTGKLVDTQPIESATENKVIPATEKETVKAVPGNICKSTATDDDFFKLRKKMAAQKSDNAMLQEASKIFKAKCFTTSQLKNLGTLFIGDGGKYQFFDAAYSHVADMENFSSLETELKDEYFVNRFKELKIKK